MSEKTGCVMAPDTWIGRTRLQSRCTTVAALSRGQSRRGQPVSTSLDVSEMDRRPKSSLHPIKGVSGSIGRRTDQAKLHDLSSSSDDDVTSIAPSLVEVDDIHPLGVQLDGEVGNQTVVADQQKRIEELESQLSTSQTEIERLKGLALEVPAEPSSDKSNCVSHVASRQTACDPNLTKSVGHSVSQSVCFAAPVPVNPAKRATASAGSKEVGVAPSKPAPRPCNSSNPTDEGKKSPCRYWTPDEHSRFLEGVEKYGYKDIKAISRHVETRNATQVRTHAQKYYLRLAREANKANNGHNPVEALQNPVTQPSVDSHSGNPVPKAALEAAREQAAKMAAKGGTSTRTSEAQNNNETSLASNVIAPALCETRKASRARKDANHVPRKRLKARSEDGGHGAKSAASSVEDVGVMEKEEETFSEGDFKEDETDQSDSLDCKWHGQDEDDNVAGDGNLLRSKSMQTIISLLSSNPTGRMEGVESDSATLGLLEGEPDLNGLTIPDGLDERRLSLEQLTSLPLTADMPELSELCEISPRPANPLREV